MNVGGSDRSKKAKRPRRRARKGLGKSACDARSVPYYGADGRLYVHHGVLYSTSHYTPTAPQLEEISLRGEDDNYGAAMIGAFLTGMTFAGIICALAWWIA